MNRFVACAVVATSLLCTNAARAQLTYNAYLDGLHQNPVNASTAVGFAVVLLSADQSKITVDLTFSGLTTPATAAHIHGPAAPGFNAGVLFPFSGVPAATSGTIPQQTFTITPTQVGYLQSGLLYVNVHDATYPGGEIRGQLTLVPEPSSFALLLLGGLIPGFYWLRNRR